MTLKITVAVTYYDRTTLEAFVHYHYAQGLAAKELAAEELFVPSTLERSKI